VWIETEDVSWVICGRESLPAWGAWIETLRQLMFEHFGEVPSVSIIVSRAEEKQYDTDRDERHIDAIRVIS
jgi:hypothetical protein